MGPWDADGKVVEIRDVGQTQTPREAPKTMSTSSRQSAPQAKRSR